MTRRAGDWLVCSGPQTEQLVCLLDGVPGLALEVGVSGRSDRMVDDNERITGQTERARHEFRAADERCGHDPDTGRADALSADGVVQTARRAAASIAETGEHDRPIGRLVDQFRLGGRRVVRLGSMHHLGHPPLVAE